MDCWALLNSFANQNSSPHQIQLSCAVSMLQRVLTFFPFTRLVCGIAARVHSCWWTPRWSTRSPFPSIRPPSAWRPFRSPARSTWPSSPASKGLGGDSHHLLFLSVSHTHKHMPWASQNTSCMLHVVFYSHLWDQCFPNFIETHILSRENRTAYHQTKM